jgi:hypothetical protein
MKRSLLVIGGLLVVLFALWKCSSSPSNQRLQVAYAKHSSLPADVLPCCTVNPDTFKTWFAGGKVTNGGIVKPANSVAFPHNNNCDFYRWSEQMFLWITSPVKYSTVMGSSVFYNVSVSDSGKRVLLQNNPNLPLKMTSHLNKVGPNGLPIVKDIKGRLFEIEPSPLKNAPVQDSAGKTVLVDHVIRDLKGKFSFIDKAGSVIKRPKAMIAHANSKSIVVHRFITRDKKFIFLDANGNQVQSEQGQATGDVLMSQNGSLVYYLTMVNDVYAYFLTMTRVPALQQPNFPTTVKDRNAICNYARLHHITLPDSNALAIELKSSWVEASSLPDTTAAGYITIRADIQQYDTTSKIRWIPKGHKVVKMAMVGMHIVGSVAGHPEMIWATFEHANNTPNAAYAYVDKNNHVKKVPQDSGSGWLFSNKANDPKPNVAHMGANAINLKQHIYGDTIVADSGHQISASNTLRSQPWGTTADSLSNAEDTTSARSNSQVLSINNSVLGMLAPGDLRGNYLLIGATWTNSGTAPNRDSYGRHGANNMLDTANGVAIGTNVLSNSTMETYMQSPVRSCFFCHSTHQADAGHIQLPPSLSPNVLSHVFAEIEPLTFVKPKKPQLIKK